LSNDWEKIKLKEEAISEFLVADTGLKSGDVTCDVEDDLEEEEKDQQQQKQKQQQQQASAEVKPQAAISDANLGTA